MTKWKSRCRPFAALRGRARLRESWGRAEAKRGVRECGEGMRLAFHTRAAERDGA